MNPMWFIRMARWARHPPSRRMIQVVGLVLGLALVLWGIEHFFGWPEWLTVNGGRRGMPRLSAP